MYKLGKHTVVNGTWHNACGLLVASVHTDKLQLVILGSIAALRNLATSFDQAILCSEYLTALQSAQAMTSHSNSWNAY